MLNEISKLRNYSLKLYKVILQLLYFFYQKMILLFVLIILRL